MRCIFLLLFVIFFSQVTGEPLIWVKATLQEDGKTVKVEWSAIRIATFAQSMITIHRIDARDEDYYERQYTGQKTNGVKNFVIRQPGMYEARYYQQGIELGATSNSFQIGSEDISLDIQVENSDQNQN